MSPSTGSSPSNATAAPTQPKTLSRRSWRRYVTPIESILTHKYKGTGAPTDPYLIDWLPNDLEDPLKWSPVARWIQMIMVGLATLTLTSGSSAYTGGAKDIVEEFHVSDEVVLLGVSLYVLGFGAGPLIWVPLTDVYGRRALYLFSFWMLTLWASVTAASQNMASILIFRFLAGFFGGVPLAGGAASAVDLFPVAERSVSVSVFVATAFLGPAIGPICGGFLGQSAGWRWIQGFLGIFSGTLAVIMTLFAAETCGPVLLRQRAKRLSKATGMVYIYRGDTQGVLSTGKVFIRAISSPWKFLLEPIIILLTLYLSIIYGIVYLDFAAFPIVYGTLRGWNGGVTGLSFIGIIVGVISGVLFTILYASPQYVRRLKARGGKVLPEDRLVGAMVGGVASLISLVGFAANDNPEVHWSASIIFGIPFGFGVVLIFLSIIGYLVDAYTVFAAPVVAANAFVRAAFAAGFPLVAEPMYKNLGVHWAAAIPAFLLLACLPPTYLLMKYGAQIRARGKWAARAEEQLNTIMAARLADAAADAGPAAAMDEEAIMIAPEELLSVRSRDETRSIPSNN